MNSTQTLYKKAEQHWKEVVDLPPQNVGPFTPLYKDITKRMKIMPWPLFLCVACVLVFGLYYLFGSGITLLTTILQRGF